MDLTTTPGMIRPEDDAARDMIRQLIVGKLEGLMVPVRIGETGERCEFEAKLSVSSEWDGAGRLKVWAVLPTPDRGPGLLEETAQVKLWASVVCYDDRIRVRWETDGPTWGDPHGPQGNDMPYAPQLHREDFR
jgi:hypothetical protein